MTIDTTKDFSFSVHSNYDNFRLNQYHIDIEGLWKLNSEYYILCPNLTDETKAINGQLLQEWYENNKILLCRTELTNNVPSGAEEVKELSTIEISELAGIPRNLTLFYNDLLHALPKEFPIFKVKNGEKAQIDLFTENQLSEEELEILKNTIRLQQMPLVVETRVVKDLGAVEDNLISAPNMLWHHKKFSGLQKSSTIKRLWEKDEDFWSDNKKKILGSVNKGDFLPVNWDVNKSSCIVTDYIEPDNLRSFLTLFDTTYLNLPVVGNEKEFFKSLDVSFDELGQLVEMNRVKFLLPYALQRYSPELLSFISGINEDNYLLSRQLACHTITDLRNRNPLLFPTINMDVRISVLKEMNLLFGKDKKLDAIGSELVRTISKSFGNYFENIHRFGAMGLQHAGAYNIFEYLIRQMTGKDLSIEMLDTAPSVEFGAALNATIIPKYWNGYSDENMAVMLSNLYSGIPSGKIPTNWNYSNTAVDDILIINKEVPIVELAKTFSGGDIDRFREMIFNLTKHKKDEVQLFESIKLFNDLVSNFESSDQRTKKIGLTGFLIGGAGSQAAIPLTGWISERINQLLLKIGLSNKSVQLLMDNLATMRTNEALPNAVMVARMRSQLKSEWYKSKTK